MPAEYPEYVSLEEEDKVPEPHSDQLEEKEVMPGVKGKNLILTVHCNVHSSLRCHLFSVEMYVNDQLFRAGTVVPRTEFVHNNQLQEAKLRVDSLYDERSEQVHPKYGYQIELGSFTQWPLEDIVCMPSV